MSEKMEELGLLIDLLLKRGADAVDGMVIYRESTSVSQRLEVLDRLEHSESFDLGLRVFMGRRQAIVSSTYWPSEDVESFVERALAMARTVPEDPYCGLAEEEYLTQDVYDLDLCSSEDPPTTEDLKIQVQEMESAALAVQGITNSEGAEASWGCSTVLLASSHGFRGTYKTSLYSLSVCTIAGTGTQMERDYEFSTKVYREDLERPEEVGRRAGERTVCRLGGRKVQTQKVPVVYHPRVAGSLLRHLSSALSGTAIARQTSFLQDSMDKRVFTKGISVMDDPFVIRGLRSRPFDGEGVLPRRYCIIEDGYLTTWLLNLSTARQLGLSPTGHATRSPSSVPGIGAANMTLTPGQRTPEELIADIGSGFFVTELIGHGVNMTTGDYSRGAAGFWIENGHMTYPVHEVTIAGNLKDMFSTLEAANDLEVRYGIDSPTVRIEGMTVAGQ